MSALRRVSLVLTWTDNDRAEVMAVPAVEPVQARCVYGPDECASAGLPLIGIAGRLKNPVVAGARDTSRERAAMT